MATNVSLITTKKWYESKTIWISIISIVTGFLIWIQGQVETGASITFMGALMTLLRLVTSTRVE